MSKWKAGQIVTIKGKKHRLVKTKNSLFINCLHCSLFDEEMCETLCEKPNNKVPDDCYFKEIKPKS